MQQLKIRQSIAGNQGDGELADTDLARLRSPGAQSPRFPVVGIPSPPQLTAPENLCRLAFADMVDRPTQLSLWQR